MKSPDKRNPVNSRVCIYIYIYDAKHQNFINTYVKPLQCVLSHVT